MLVLLFWLLGIWGVFAVVISFCTWLFGQEDFPTALAVGLLWWFWLGRAVFREAIRIYKHC